MKSKDEIEVYYLCGGELKPMDENSISCYWAQNIQLKLLTTLSESFIGASRLFPPADSPVSAQKTKYQLALKLLKSLLCISGSVNCVVKMRKHCPAMQRSLVTNCTKTQPHNWQVRKYGPAT